jgi:hypothetical protein
MISTPERRIGTFGDSKMPTFGGWMGDWSDIADDVRAFAEIVSDIDFSEMFANANNQRARAINQAGLLVTPPVRGSNIEISSWWRTLAKNAYTMAGYYVRSLFADGSPYTPVGRYSIATCLNDIQYDGVKEPQNLSQTFEHTDGIIDSAYTYTNLSLAFPVPNGWSCYERLQIFSLADTGIDGQRARLVCGTSNSAIEKALSGKFFDRISGVWSLSNDQLSLGTEVQRYRTPVTGFSDNLTDALIPLRDSFDGRFITQLRNAYNQLVFTGAKLNPNNRFLPLSIDAVGYHLNASNINADGGRRDASSSLGGTQTQAYTNFDASSRSGAAGVTPGAEALFQPFSSSGFWTVSRQENRLSVNGSPTLHNPDGLFRRAISFVFPEWNSIDLNGIQTFKEFGDGNGAWVRKHWQLHGVAVSTDSNDGKDALVFPFLGNALSSHPTFSSTNHNDYFGWKMLDYAAILDWSVTGGFEQRDPSFPKAM